MRENSVTFTASFPPAQCDHCNGPLGEYWVANRHGKRLCDVVCAEAWAVEKAGRDMNLGPDEEEEEERSVARYILIDHDSPIADARNAVIGAAFSAMVELVCFVENAKKAGAKNPRTEDLIAKIDALLVVMEEED